MELKQGGRYLMVHHQGLGLLTYLGEETSGHKFQVTRSDGVVRIMHFSPQQWREMEPFCHEQGTRDVSEAVDSIETAREFLRKLKEGLHE